MGKNSNKRLKQTYDFQSFFSLFNSGYKNGSTGGGKCNTFPLSNQGLRGGGGGKWPNIAEHKYGAILETSPYWYGLKERTLRP